MRRPKTIIHWPANEQRGGGGSTAVGIVSDGIRAPEDIGGSTWDSQTGFPMVAHSSLSYCHHFDGEEEGRRRTFNDEAENWAHVSCASRETHLTTRTMNSSITTGGGYAQLVGWMRSSEEVSRCPQSCGYDARCGCSRTPRNAGKKRQKLCLQV